VDDHDYRAGYSADNDPFVYPDTGVLKNKLGLYTTAELNEEEIKFTGFRAMELETQPVARDFDLPHLTAIHRHIFQDVYPWAGEVRTVDIAKGSTHFAPHHTIEKTFATLHNNLKKENYLLCLPPEKFAERLAGYLGEINFLHPFREGNGRTQRQFSYQLSQRAGYALDWRAIGNHAMRDACIHFEHNDATKLTRLIQLNITPIKTVEPIRQAVLSPAN
jgi:cell filamentation protein